jgi:hypothetical protein
VGGLSGRTAGRSLSTRGYFKLWFCLSHVFGRLETSSHRGPNPRFEGAHNVGRGRCLLRLSGFREQKELTCLINAAVAGHVRLGVPAQPVDATPSNINLLSKGGVYGPREETSHRAASRTQTTCPVTDSPPGAPICNGSSTCRKTCVTQRLRLQLQKSHAVPAKRHRHLLCGRDVH